MTHDEMIAVISAHRDGKKIESKHKIHAEHTWKLSNPIWNFDEFEYRVKREPRILMLHEGDICPSASPALFILSGRVVASIVALIIAIAWITIFLLWQIERSTDRLARLVGFWIKELVKNKQKEE